MWVVEMDAVAPRATSMTSQNHGARSKLSTASGLRSNYFNPLTSYHISLNLSTMFKKEELNISRVTYESGGVELEGLIFKPNQSGKLPGVIFIHGYDGNCWSSSLTGYFLSKSGFAVFLPSQMGYGLSGGKPDYVGPKTVEGIIDGISSFLNESFVDKDQVGIWGISRGATATALIATKKPAFFKAAVFQSGAYEMKKNYETTKIEGIRDNIEKEAGTTDTAFQERSPVYAMENVKFPVLILHGEKDENISVEQAQLLDEELNRLGKVHETIIIPEAPHFISKQTRRQYVFPFLEKELKKLDT